MSEKDKLFDRFPPVSTDEWMKKIISDLKGDDFNTKLVWKTNEDFEVKPYYRSEDTETLPNISLLPGEYPYIRGTRKKDNVWLIRQNIEVIDYVSSNKKALDILTKGVNSLGFVLSDPESITAKNIKTLLKGINCESVEINFLSDGRAKEILGFLIKDVKKKGLNPSTLKGSIEADPLGRLMVKGNICIPVDSGLDYLASLAKEASSLPYFKTVRVNGSNFTNAGTDIVKEIAFSLSMANEYMSQLTDRRLSSDLAASKICFSFGIGTNYFMEIAKLRAARLLWSTVVSAYRPEKEESLVMTIHSVTGKWNKTIFDPYVNLLRTQTESMSAVLGGADSITTEPFDIVFRKPDEFSERIARNQQLLLKEEAYFDKTADPAGGSYYIENLTFMIAEKSWKLFVEIEEQGGFLSSLKKGFIQNLIKESAGKRKTDILMKKEILLGTNKYPDLNEILSSVDLDKIFSGQPDSSENIIEPVSMFRGSEELDKIRISSSGAFKNEFGFMNEKEQ
jgi:methylmalonyl-CoA mutase